MASKKKNNNTVGSENITQHNKTKSELVWSHSMLLKGKNEKRKREKKSIRQKCSMTSLVYTFL
jgi:hypothetical protein